MNNLLNTGLVVALGLAGGIVPRLAHAAGYQILHSFAGGMDGQGPFGALVRDKAGDLYGTTSSGGHSNGTVFKLAKPAAGVSVWKEIVLYAFRGGAADGANPDAGIVMDKTGALYGTTQSGGFNANDGTIFRLAPPAAGQTAWTETILHRFGPQGANPVAALAAGADGTLYGTTCGCGAGDFSEGTVFSLSPPTAGSDVWAFRTLHAFTGGLDGGHSHAPVTVGPLGVLYGTSSAGGLHNAGNVFSLSPPSPAGGLWKETVLFSFTGGRDGAYPRGGAAIDAAGHVLTTAQYGGNGAFGNGAGTLIELSPPPQTGHMWSETTVHVFDGLAGGGQPGSTPIVAKSGVIYGTTDLGGNTKVCTNFSDPPGCGIVYALHPPAAGAHVWRETVLHSFVDTDGNLPWGALTRGSTGLYGTTALGGSAASGTVFSITP